MANSGCGSVSILLGNGDGIFGAPQGFGNNIDVLPSQLATGDFNDDGNLDLVVASAALNGLGASVLLGHGDGTLFAGTRGQHRGGHAAGGGGR